MKGWSDPRIYRLLLALFAGVVLAFTAIAIANALLPGKTIKDYALWHETGQHMWHGEEIYPERGHKFDFMYPPAAAVLLAPVSLLGRTGVVAALALITAGAWLASILLSARLAGGDWQRAHPLVYAIPSLLVVVYVWSNFHIGQPSLVLLALLLGAFLALQTQRQSLAGALIALAAGIKAFPFIAIVYLIYRRYWRATAALLVSLVLLLLVLPGIFRGFGQAASDLRQWSDGMLFKYDESGVAQRPGRSNSWKNQSIFGVANRLLRHIDADEKFAAHTPIYVNVADLSFATVNRLVVATGLLLGLLYVAVMPRRADRTRATDALEFALFLLLLLMFTPLSFGYLYACLLYPFTVIVTRLLAAPRPRLSLATGVAILLLALTIPWQRGAQLYGNVFLATLILFLGLAAELWQERREITR